MRNENFFNKCASYGILVFVVFVFQSALGNFITIAGISPCLLLGIVVCAGAFESELFASVLSVITGFAVDSYSERIFGFFLLMFAVTGYVSARLFKSYLRLTLQNVCLMVMACTFVYELLIYLAFFFTGPDVSFFWVIFTKIVPTTLYSGVGAIPIFYLTRHIANETADKEENEF